MNIAMPFHPVLAALAPVLLLLSANAAEAPPLTALRAALTAVLLVGILWTVLAVGLRSVARAAGLTTLLVVFGSTTLPLSRAVAGMANLGESGYRWALGAGLIIVWLLIIAIVIRRVLTASRLNALNRNFNLMLACLLMVPIANIAFVNLSDTPTADVVSPPSIEVQQARHLPDVYYIIPDAYGRGDVLESMYGYDNREFLQALEDLGFIVCEASVSNYSQTALSLPSSLNMSYLHPPEDDAASNSRTAAFNALLDNAVMKAFSDAGYTTVVHSSSYTFADIRSADVYLSPGPNEFEQIAIGTFLGRLWFSLRDIFGWDLSRYGRITAMLETLGEERQMRDPVFVFAHFLAPHPSFIFNEDGSERCPVGDDMHDEEHFPPVIHDVDAYRAAYIRQLKGVNVHLLEAVRRIIAATDDPCIIIIQGDHGPGAETRWEEPENTNMPERMGIINAYLLPEEAGEHLYPEITPVNSFRLVLNHVLGTDLELLEDRAYFSRWSRPYDFIDVTDRVRDGAEDAAE